MEVLWFSYLWVVGESVNKMLPLPPVTKPLLLLHNKWRCYGSVRYQRQHEEEEEGSIGGEYHFSAIMEFPTLSPDTCDNFLYWMLLKG